MNNDKAYYESEEFWNTAPQGAEALIDYQHFARWVNGLEYWYTGGEWQEQSWSWQKGWYLERPDTFSLIERPKFTKPEQEKVMKNNEWNGEGHPPVGTKCEYRLGSGNWFECEIRYVCQPIEHSDGVAMDFVIYCPHLKGEQGVCTDGEQPVSFRPIKKEPNIQEKMLDKWKLQSLDYAHDTTSSQYTLGSVFDFVVKNFNVEDKEEN